MDLETYLSRRGAATEMGRALGITHSAVLQWIKNGVPAERVLAIEVASGGKLSRHVLRPDLFGPSPDLVAPANVD
jgi:DNA-binding transcriptional regulator YdaS (Cro superfamily)